MKRGPEQYKSSAFLDACIRRVLHELEGTGLYGVSDSISFFSHVFFGMNHFVPSSLKKDENLP